MRKPSTIFSEFHPLDVWLLDHEETVVSFAERNNMAFSTVYNHIRGGRPNPKLTHMQTIEDGTNNEVSVQMQSDWLRRKMKAQKQSRPSKN